MKYLTLLFVVFINFHIHAQIPVFPTDSAVWQTQVSYEGLYPYYIDCNYFLAGDTMIESQLYQKIYAQRYAATPEIFAATRIEQGIVYVRKFDYVADCGGGGFFDLGPEYVFYDFNLNVGDTLFYDTPYGSELAVACIAVDSVMVDNQSIKRLTVSGAIGNEILFQDEWISGIGSIRGPFMVHANTLDNFSYLACFKSDDLVYHHPEFGEACFVSTTNVLLEEALTIYPNPIISGEVLTIETDDITATFDWELFTTQGLRVEIGVADNGSILFTKELAPGLYILHLKNGPRLAHTARIVVQ